MFGDIFSMTCQACGATIGDLEVHQAFHDSLGEVARRVFAPDLSPEEWKAQVEAAIPAARALVEAERAVNTERQRQAWEQAKGKRSE